MQPIRLFSIAVAALVLLTAPAARAMDLYWESKTVTALNYDGKTEQMSSGRQSYSLKDNLLRVDDTGKRRYRIYNFHQRTAVLVDLEAGMFAEVSFRQMARRVRNERDRVKKSLQQKEKTLSSLPPEAKNKTAAKIHAQRKKYNLWGRRYRVRKTEERKTVSGHPCVKYEGLSGDQVFQEIWVAEDIKIDRHYKVYYARGMKTIDPQEGSHLGRLPGFPMKVITHYGSVTVTEEMTHVSEHKIPAKAFLLPEELKPADSSFKPY
ncbi:MAG: DUF4412 domain-containing protein [bacterium]